MKIFLGGTWNKSTWRNRMMIYLNEEGIDYFNPIVDDWNKRPNSTILILLRKDNNCTFTSSQWDSLVAVATMVKRNGGLVFYDLKSVVVELLKKGQI